MAINKETLAALIAAQTGNNDFDVDSITDEMLLGLEIEEEIEEEEVEDTDDEETEDEDENEDEDDDEDDIPEDPFAGVDPNSLSPTERLFYDYVISEKKRTEAREKSLLIQGAPISIQHKLVLERMSKEGLSIKAIEKTINDFKQIEASSARTGGKSKIISKSKSKKTIPADKKIPKPGTKEFGQYLASLKKK